MYLTTTELALDKVFSTMEMVVVFGMWLDLIPSCIRFVLAVACLAGGMVVESVWRRNCQIDPEDLQYLRL